MKVEYFKKLDLLRFIAFFLVFWQHAFSDFFVRFTFIDKQIIENFTHTGGLGVQFFFVLSGFLITFLLLKELQEFGNISLKKFYMRRVLRIWPLYYLIVISGVFFLPYFFKSFQFCGNIVYNFFFLNNFDFGNPCPAKNVNITWSVAIEEQFYLVWPVLFILLRNKIKFLFIISFALIILGFVYKINASELNAYFHTFGNVSYLMIGCCGAILFSKYRDLISSNSYFGKFQLYVVFLLIFLLILFQSVFSMIFLPILFLYIIYYFIVNEKNDHENFFSKLGKYTYGMYLYHPTIIIFSKMIFDILKIEYQNAGVGYLFLGLLSFLLTVLVSIISYNIFEKKILNLKRYFIQV